MIPNAQTLNNLAAVWAALLGTMLWQSTVLALVVAAICFGLRRSAPGIRYWLWQIVALKLLVLPLWTLAVPMPAMLARSFSAEPAVLSNAAPGVPATVPGTRSALRGQSPDTLLIPQSSLAESRSLLGAFSELTLWSWLLLLWVLVVLVQVGRLLRQRILLGRLLRYAEKETNSTILEQLSALAGRLNLRRVPALLSTDSDCSPFVCGLWRPLLVVPRVLLTELGPEQLEQVFLHELAHVRRGDLVWGWLPELARWLWFFHPVAHWASARVRLERELACDQLAMALSSRSAADYAQVLVQVVSRASSPRVLTAGAPSLALDGGAGPAERQQPAEEHQT